MCLLFCKYGQIIDFGCFNLLCINKVFSEQILLIHFFQPGLSIFLCISIDFAFAFRCCACLHRAVFEASFTKSLCLLTKATSPSILIQLNLIQSRERKWENYVNFLKVGCMNFNSEHIYLLKGYFKFRLKYSKVFE